MRRAERLFRLINRLRPGKLTTARDLAIAMEVSERTIYRDIAHLQGSGVPIEGEAGLGYMMREGYDLPPLMFSEEEIIALTVGARMIQTWGGTAMRQGADAALEKIHAILPDATLAAAEGLAVQAWTTKPLSDADRARIDVIQAAIADSERLRMVYRDEAGAQTARTIRPLGLWFWGSVWTHVAWCELRNGFRMFRIDRMTELAPIGQFEPRPGQDLQTFYRSDYVRQRPPRD